MRSGEGGHKAAAETQESLALRRGTAGQRDTDSQATNPGSANAEP